SFDRRSCASGSPSQLLIPSFLSCPARRCDLLVGRAPPPVPSPTMAEMTEEEWRAFLRSPVRAASLATTRRDGRPHVAPVWYDVDDDGTVVFNTGADTVK